MTTKKTKLIVQKRKNLYVFKHDEKEFFVYTQVEMTMLLGAMIGATIESIKSRNYDLIFNLTNHEYKN